jgi:fibro-slime domain-containing protein
MRTTTEMTVGGKFGFLTAAGAMGLLCLADTPALAGGTEQPPETIELGGIVRDFLEKTDPNGHPDFEQKPDLGFGHYCGNVSPYLGEDRKPVFTGDGWKVYYQWRDAEGRPICYSLYDPEMGDHAGQKGPASTGGIQSADSFRTWFNDVPGSNISMPLVITLTFVLQEDGSYLFDDKLDPIYGELGGFFPIEHQLFGNPGGYPDRNFHFTFELHTEFVYEAGAGQVFKFIGDDDVWVYVNGRLVIDLGGVHAATEQFVDMDRLGLTDGETYPLDFFFAERHRTQSNFRVQTNLKLQNTELPAITAAFD